MINKYLDHPFLVDRERSPCFPRRAQVARHSLETRRHFQVAALESGEKPIHVFLVVEDMGRYTDGAVPGGDEDFLVPKPTGLFGGVEVLMPKGQDP